MCRSISVGDDGGTARNQKSADRLAAPRRDDDLYIRTDQLSMHVAR